MKISGLFFLFCLPASLLAQDLKVLQPKVGKKLDFGPAVQKQWAIRDKALKALSAGEKSWDDLTTEEETAINNCEETYENMWDIIGSACSFYCGSAAGKVRASTSLSAQGTNTYGSENINDFSYQTAWVEGVPGYGIGEYIDYEFPPENPRINTIIIVNGYVKSASAYTTNSRVKQLKMYVNGAPYALLNLEDVAAEQSFVVDLIGYPDRASLEMLKKRAGSKIRFEIMDVYKGTKYDDVAITEIYFNGIDVH
ncbi:hypothetical protein [uncultured Imperialibacter sp.]|uniref:NADase-type glycan-binding domain-containing protein n=1 Tax=uncultured Imperialibacter sp. TaxID=1672639 RepID=UPI0030D7040C|tara:strand:+ start:1667 stop:2425 length:759 start_codon:yes stop_codon:yes gene_type:complete